MTKSRKIVLDWRDELKAGDVLVTPSGTRREILSVRYYGDRLAVVRLQKLQSNPVYHATYAIYTRSDIKHMKYKKAIDT